MSKLARRNSGSLDLVDTAVGIAAVVIVGIIAISVLGAVFSALAMLFKIAIFALIAAVAWRFLTARRHTRGYSPS